MHASSPSSFMAISLSMESIKISHASLDRGQALRRLRNADWLVANGPNTGVDSDSNMQPLHADREFVRQELDVNDVRHSEIIWMRQDCNMYLSMTQFHPLVVWASSVSLATSKMVSHS